MQEWLPAGRYRRVRHPEMAARQSRDAALLRPGFHHGHLTATRLPRRRLSGQLCEGVSIGAHTGE